MGKNFYNAKFMYENLLRYMRVNKNESFGDRTSFNQRAFDYYTDRLAEDFAIDVDKLHDHLMDVIGVNNDN